MGSTGLETAAGCRHCVCAKQEVFHRSDDENELRLGFGANSSEDQLNIRLNSIGWSPQQEWNGK